MSDFVTSLHVHKQDVIVTASVMMAITTIAVALRLATKFVVKAKFGSSDLAIIVAQLIWSISTVLQIQITIMAQTVTTYIDPKIHTILLYFLTGVFYAPFILATNVSILLLYRSIFAIASFRKISLILIIAHVIWSIIVIFGSVFSCTPVNTFWANPAQLEEKCFHYSAFFAVCLALELLLDLLILILPIREITKLHMPWEKKTTLCFVFLLGGFVIISGIIRIKLSYIPHSSGVDIVQDMIWSDIHAGVAIICACLPTYRPLVSKSVSAVAGTARKLYSSGSRGDSGVGISNAGSHKLGSLSGNRSREYENYADLSGDEVNLVETKKSVSQV